jgi:uncharacterized membrane protein YhaH (DUF805 family)
VDRTSKEHVVGVVGSVRSVLSNYANFNGRAGLAEYWWWSLVLFIVQGVLELALRGLALAWLFELLLFLTLLLPSVAVTVRRLHDTNRSGWWLLIALVPVIGALVLLSFNVRDGTQGMNQYGPWPKWNEHAAAA